MDSPPLNPVHETGQHIWSVRLTRAIRAMPQATTASGTIAAFAGLLKPPGVGTTPKPVTHGVMPRINDQSESDTGGRPCPVCPATARVRTFCTVSRRPTGPLAPPTRRPGRALAGAPATAAPTPVGWRDKPEHLVPLRREVPGPQRDFDKGTLAMTLIGLTGAGQKPARSARQRTGHRPLSNPAAPSADKPPRAFLPFKPIERFEGCMFLAASSSAGFGSQQSGAASVSSPVPSITQGLCPCLPV